MRTRLLHSDFYVLWQSDSLLRHNRRFPFALLLFKIHNCL